jgi:hypothetical protein
MPWIEVAGDIYLRRPRPAQGCRADEDINDDVDISCVMTVCPSVNLDSQWIFTKFIFAYFSEICPEISRFIKN